jgi:hypothetical protein
MQFGLLWLSFIQFPDEEDRDDSRNTCLIAIKPSYAAAGSRMFYLIQPILKALIYRYINWFYIIIVFYSDDKMWI